MRKIISTLLLAGSLFASDYIVDKNYSNIKFEASKFLFVGVKGTFSEFKGNVTVDENSKISKIDGVVEISSINTDDEERDENLKSAGYFSMKNFPSIIFKSNKIIDDKIIAMVEIKGIKKELTFNIKNIEVSNTNLKFNLSSTVNRQDFMLNGKMSAVITDNIDVFANIIARKK